MARDSNSDKKNNGPEKESDLKKFLKKRSFIYLMCAVAFVVIVVPDMIAPSDLENLDNDEQNTAWQIIKSYKGANNEGFELFELMIKLIEDAYPTEKILEHRDTIFEISAVNKDLEYGVGFYVVYFTFHTVNDSKKFIWKVNILTEEIFPVNSEARQMLNYVDYYD